MRAIVLLLSVLLFVIGCADLGNQPEVPVPELAVRGDTTSEGGIAECAFELSFEAPKPVTIVYALEGITAAADQDFVAVTDTVTIAASDGTGHGEDHLHIGVPLLQDDQIEPIEEFSLRILSATNVLIVGSEASCFILDDDGAPVVTVGDVNVIEGQPAFFEVTLNKAGIFPIIFDYTTTAVTAAAGTDFQSATGTDTISIGATSAIVEINTLDDSTYDPSETFSVMLSAIQNGVLFDSLAVATIFDNDPQPAPSFTGEIKPIIGARCAFSACHGGSAGEGGLNFGAITYHDVLHATGDHGAIVIPADGANSALYFKVTTAPRFGVRMPPGGPYVPTSDMQKIKEWIDAGAPDN